MSDTAYRNPVQILGLVLTVLAITSISGAIEIQSESDWEAGIYNATTSDLDSSGSLSIGYLNGSNPNANPNLNAFWKFENNLRDSSGNNIDGISSRNLSYGNGIVNQTSANFTIADESYAEFQDSQELNPQNFTISAWIYPEDVSGFHPIVSKETSNDRGYELAIDNYFSVPRLSLTIKSQKDGEQTPRTDTAVPQNEWVHVSAVYDNAAGEVKLYVNGEKQPLYTGQYSDDPPYTYNNTDDNNLLIGATSSSTGGDYFDGKIDELRIFSNPLNHSSIQKESLNIDQGVIEGEYTSKLQERDLTGEWYSLNFYSQLDSQKSNLSGAISTFDSNNNLLEEETFSLTDGLSEFSHNSNGSKAAQIKINGTSADIENSWNLNNLSADFAGLKLNQPSDGAELVGEDVTFDFSVDSTETGTANLTLNGSTFKQYNVNEGYETFSDNLKLTSGSYNWSINLLTSSGQTFETENDSFSYEKGLIVVDEIEPNPGEIYTDGELRFIYNVTSDVDASVELLVDGEVKRTDSVSSGSQTTFNKTLNLKEDTHEWQVRTNYTDGGVSQSLTSDLTGFKVFNRTSYKTNQEFLEGFFDRTYTSDTAGDNISTGYLSPLKSNSSSYPANLLSGFWRMEKTGSLTDYSIKDNTATTANSPNTTNGVFSGTALDFSPGSGTYVEVPDSQSLNNESFTVSAWIYKDFTGLDSVPIFQKSTGQSSGFDFLVDDYFGEDRLALFVYSSSNGTQRFRTDPSIPSNQWTHVAASFDGENAYLYINGDKKTLATDSSPANIDLNTNNMLLGASSANAGGDYFDGKIDEAMIFQHSLNSTQISETAIKPDSGLYKSKYTRTIKANKAFEWKRARINNSQPQGTTLDATISVRGQTDTVNLDGSNTFRSLDLPIGASAEIKIKGSTSDPEKSWSLESLEFDKYSRNIDLRVESVNIPGDPVEKNQTPVDIKVGNFGDYDLKNVQVRTEHLVYNETGDWEKINDFNSTADLDSDQSKSMTRNVDFQPGPNKIQVEIDPENKIQGSSKDKKTSELVDVSSYTLYYGEADIDVRLQTKRKNFSLMNSAKSYGNIYFSDTDSNYLHSDLKSLNSSGALGLADEQLNISTHNDSLVEKFDRNNDGKPDNFRNFDVGSKTLDVPVINSTVYGNFKTGILYNGENNQDYDGSQELVFITEINDSSQGKFGNYDYEIKIPSALKSLSSGTDKVDIFADIPD